MIFLWFEFLLCAALVVVSGYNLTKYGDVIAEKTGLGRAWIGLVLMASVTSLPELVNGISSVAIVDAPDIALGDVMGSLVFNLTLIALMDVYAGRDSAFNGVSKGHILAAGYGILLIAIVVISISIETVVPEIGHIGIYTPLIFFTYVIGVRAVYYYEKDVVKEYVKKESAMYPNISLKKAAGFYAINALIIIVAAAYLPYVADKLAQATALGRTFMGSVIVAMTTSLPELVVIVSAMKIGAKDMALANILGSNMSDVVILAIDDIFFTRGPLFSYISPTHILTGVMAIMMTAIVIIGLARPEKEKFFMFRRESIMLILFYILTVYLLYMMRSSG